MESEEFPTLDPVMAAWFSFTIGDYEKSSDQAGKVLNSTGGKEGSLPWAIKVAALNESNRIIDEDLSDQTIGEELFSENEMQKDARPGTSLKTASKSEDGSFNHNGPSVRPQTGSRPLTGFARPGTSTRPGTGQNRLDTGRLNTAASRPLTNQGRRLMTGRLNTGTTDDQPFLNLSRLNLDHYAKDDNLGKLLFSHLTIVLGEFRLAMNLAEAALASSSDPFWKYLCAFSALRLGMIRRAEELAADFVRENSLPIGALLLHAIYKRLDQPLAARQALKVGVEANPNNLTLLANCARLEEARGEVGEAEKVFEKILGLDLVNQEALCVLAASKYYKDEPMKCLSLYRRALQTGKPCSALYNNLALASIATGQVDVAFRCYSKALQEISSDEDAEQIWYNIGNTCILIGEHQLAQQAYKISIVAGNGSYALNNLGVLSQRSDGNSSSASSLFQQAQNADAGWEAHWNSALLSYERGDHQSAYHSAKEAGQLNPSEKCVQDMLHQLLNSFQLL